jgi:hypothetical protein
VGDAPDHAIVPLAKKAGEKVLADDLAEEMVGAVAPLHPRVDQIDVVGLVAAGDAILPACDSLHVQIQRAEKPVGVDSSGSVDVHDREDPGRLHTDACGRGG